MIFQQSNHYDGRNEKALRIKAIYELSHFFDETSEEKLKDFVIIISRRMNFDSGKKTGSQKKDHKR